MEKIHIKSFKEYFDFIETLDGINQVIALYRGQPKDDPLLPSIARKDPNVDTTQREQEMLEELKRRTQLTAKAVLSTNWEWLVYAQHYGMKTRLLDWTSNPLSALWFACSNEYFIKVNSYVYAFIAENSLIINTKDNGDPFSISKTRILRPALNNERIIAQAGWFTAHRYSAKNGKFITLESNKELKQRLIQVEVPAAIKKDILRALALFGIHYQSLFPDIVGICKHINWIHDPDNVPETFK